ncbi:hypothetical protein B0J18DRAFT_364509 [Chaetomium sp. MPI-SDFR-AT-0129]|nr:hypothetical protein B0J18DRAFT_364509 [Chaetomium sp. MPI-SDFR-AT-0129]
MKIEEETYSAKVQTKSTALPWNSPITPGIRHKTDANTEGGPGSDGSGSRKKRGRFSNEVLRRQTSNTRTMGACLRCHNQKIRCTPNPSDDTNPFAPCKTCLGVRRDSKKMIHYIPCLRFKLSMMTLYRAGGLNYTQRFDHTKVTDVVDYVDDVIYDIEIAQNFCPAPLPLRVRRFKPETSDLTRWKYLEDGIPKSQDTGAFCLASIEKTAREFNQHYINVYALKGLQQVGMDSDDLTRGVFEMIEVNKHPNLIVQDPLLTTKHEEPREGSSGNHQAFLLKLIRLWFAIRHGTGSAWYSRGEESLGLSSVLPSGKIPVSRMIVAQFDSIRHERVFKKIAPEVLRTIETFLTSSNKEAWFTVFLATFLLLHQVASTSKDRYRHAKQNSRGQKLETRYGKIMDPLVVFVEEAHHSAVMLLAYWQYYKRCDLMNFNWDSVTDSPLSCLESYQVEFLKRTVGLLKEKRKLPYFLGCNKQWPALANITAVPSIPTTPIEGCWEHELFWVSKMFMSTPSLGVDWNPPETFTVAKPSVGNEEPQQLSGVGRSILLNPPASSNPLLKPR